MTLQADNVDTRTDHVVGVLLTDPDAVRRYHTVKALQSGRLREIQAITLRQLELEHGSVAAAADAVGISRQSAGELLERAQAPAGRRVRELPAYAYGTYLAAACSIAWSLPDDGRRRDKALDRWYDLEAQAPQTLTMLPAVTETAMGWLRSLRHRRPQTAEARERELHEAGAAMAEWVASRQDNPRLTCEEQMAVYVALSSGRRAAREHAG